jgi:polyketide cyclase/dehydrase/lipid transport protein
MYQFHHESTVLVAAHCDDIFAFVDDHSKLSSHMSQRSWMMGGGTMSIEMDAKHGRAVGSTIRLSGSVLGVKLSVEETVTERLPPQRKTWRTVGEPRLLVIGAYQMGVEIEPRGESSLLRVFIDYTYPTKRVQRWIGGLFAASYAKWCTDRMARDAAEHFRKSAA